MTQSSSTPSKLTAAASFSHELLAPLEPSARTRSMSTRVPVTPDEREPLLTERRRAKMTSSPHAYVRGSTQRFYEWLLSARGERLPRSPNIWIGGDCHIGNIGAIARVDGHTELERRDLDQTVIGAAAHDVVRLTLSMAMAIRASGLRGSLTLRAAEQIARGYERMLEAHVARVASPSLGVAPPQVTKLLRRAGHRSRRDLLKERVGDGVRIPIGKRFWPLTDDELEGVEQLVASRPFQKLVTSLTSRADDAKVTLVDAAFWVKGCSSLGLWRVAIVVRVGSKSKGTLALVDVKEARKAVAPRARGVVLDRHDGRRVVRGARALSPHLGARMMAATVRGIPVYVRELLPQDLKLELDAIEAKDVAGLAAYLGSVVGIAHARQLTRAACSEWLETFRKDPAPHSTAPAWLWSSVVDLVALHEGAYLEYCREHEGEVLEQLQTPHVTGD